MNILLTKLSINDAKKDVLVGVMGASAAQTFSALLVPIVARLFLPEHFGDAATFLAVATLVSSFASLGYEQGIILPSTEQGRKALSALAVRILLVFTLALVIGVWIMTIFPIKAFGTYDPSVWVILFPVFLVVSGWANILQVWNCSQKRFPNIATADVVSTLGSSGGRCGLGFVFGSSVLGLLCGTLLGQIARIVALWDGMHSRETLQGGLWRLSSGLAKQLMVQYREFPLYSAPTTFIREIKDNLPLLGLSFLFSGPVVGLYAMAMRILLMPISLVSTPVWRVFTQKAAQGINEGRSIRKLLLKTTALLFALGALPFLLLAMYASDLFPLLLGANWRGAGLYAEIISGWLFTMFLLTPASAIFVVVRKQQVWMMFQVVGAIMGLLVFLSAALLSMNEHEVLKIFSSAQIGLNVAIFFTALHFSSRLQGTEKEGNVDLTYVGDA